MVNYDIMYVYLKYFNLKHINAYSLTHFFNVKPNHSLGLLIGVFNDHS